MDNREKRIAIDPSQRIESDEDARELGRQIAMDAILEMSFADRVRREGKPTPKIVFFQSWKRIIAAAAIIVVTVSTFFYYAANHINVKLRPGWSIAPVGDAKFRVVKDFRIDLDHGELFISPDPDVPDRSPLYIATPNARVKTLQNSSCYVGSHTLQAADEPPTSTCRNSTPKRLTP